VWAGRVRRWRESGVTAGEFARRLGVSESSLRWWSWKLGSTSRADTRKAKAQAMSPLTFVEMTAPLQRAPIEVALAGGVRVIVPADFDDAALERVLAVLDRRQ
jgi:transposase-like protein